MGRCSTAFALASVVGGCAAAPRPCPPERDGESVRAASAPLPADACPDTFDLEGRLSDRITDPPTVIRQRSEMGGRYRLVRAVYAIDRHLVFARRFDEVRPPDEMLEVFAGRIRPGRHALTVVLEFEGNPLGRFVDVTNYRVTLRSTRAFVLGEGDLADVEVRARAREDVAADPTGVDARGEPSRPERPRLEVDFGFKPAQR
jgi:hypothetical protein